MGFCVETEIQGNYAQGSASETNSRDSVNVRTSTANGMPCLL